MTRIARRIRQLAGNRNGSVVVFTAIGLFLLLGLAGVGVDFGRQQIVRNKLQVAADAAALAAAFAPEGTTVAERQTIAIRYYNLNFPSDYLDIARPSPQVEVSAATVRITANTRMPTSFLSNIGVSSLPINSLSEVSITGSTATSDYDIVLVVDESGSEGSLAPDGRGTRMDAQIRAANVFIGSIFPAGVATNPNIRFGLVGYTGFISNAHALTSDGTTARTYTANLRPRFQNYDHYAVRAGGIMLNGGLPGFPPDATINDTTGHETGRDFWLPYSDYMPIPQPATARSDGQTTAPVKNMILITDGGLMLEPQIGSPVTEASQLGAFVDECNKVKANGVRIWTAIFASTFNTPRQIKAMEDCASPDPSTGTPQFTLAGTEDTLTEFLSTASESIQSIRITQ
ncbi:MAG: VWA domain-containing protein [Rickettsiales bacterium]